MVSPKGKAWKLKELALNKIYTVHPDDIITHSDPVNSRFHKLNPENLHDITHGDSSDSKTPVTPQSPTDSDSLDSKTPVIPQPLSATDNNTH